MPPSPTTARALLATSGLVFAAGAVLAIAQPGDLGDDDGADDTAQAATSTTLAPTATTALGDPTATTVSVPGGDGGPGTTAPGSGLGSDGASVADNGTAATGMESMLAPGLGLLAAAGLARAAARRRAEA